MKDLLQEFKKFAIKGNVMDMTVGVIIGSAFGKIVSSLVSDIIMPAVGSLTGGVDFSKLAITLRPATESKVAVSLNYGMFFNTIIDFLIIAASIFLVVRQLNKLKKTEEQKPADTPENILLLREIRDSLTSKQS